MFLLKHVLIRGLLLPLAACLYLVRYTYLSMSERRQSSVNPASEVAAIDN